MLNYRVISSTKNSEREYEVREYDPCKRTISIDGEYFFLPFPYVVFCNIKYLVPNSSQLFVHFACEPYNRDLSHKAQYLYAPCLPNVSLDGRICLSSSISFNGSIGEMIRAFWGRSFSSYASEHCTSNAVDRLKRISGTKLLDDTYSHYISNIEKYLKAWSKMSPKKFISRLRKEVDHYDYDYLTRWGFKLD